MSKGDIILSEKYGVNPTMPVCDFCGGDTGEIALLGKLTARKAEKMGIELEPWQKTNPNDCEAPRHIPSGTLEPCAKCKEEKITMLEARINTVTGKPERTGRWLQLMEEDFKANFKDDGEEDGMMAATLKMRVAYMEPEAFDQVAAAIEASQAAAKQEV